MNESEKKWQAESDANTMSRYEEIINDKKRLGAARSYAQKESKKLQDAANRMTRVSKPTSRKK